jgi:antitoxin component of MazEF toxin-antitoxin module
MNVKSGNKEISRTWRTGKSSCTIVIPKRFAEQLGLDKSSHIIIERVQDGLLVKKLEMD